MPFTLRNLEAHLEDIRSNFDGARTWSSTWRPRRSNSSKSGLSHQSIPPGYRFPYGHTHEKQEEVYVVVGGGGRMKLDDEIIELREWDAVRVPPARGEATRPGPMGSRLLVFGAPNLGDNPRDDVEGRRDWWVD